LIGIGTACVDRTVAEANIDKPGWTIVADGYVACDINRVVVDAMAPE
jgi:hypothetical protein